MTTVLALETNGALIATDQAGSVAVTQSGPLRYMRGKGSRVNFHTNPSAQVNGSTGVLALGTSVTVSRIANDGPRASVQTCFECVTPGSAVNEGFFASSALWPLVEPGQTLRVAFSAKRLSGLADFQVIVQTRNGANATADSVATVINLTGEWQRYTFEIAVNGAYAATPVFYVWRGALALSACRYRISDIVVTTDTDTTPLDYATPGVQCIDPTTGYLQSLGSGVLATNLNAVVDPATTNLVLNPWCHVDAVGYAGTNAAVARSTNARWQGTAGLAVTATGANAEGSYSLTVPATTHTLSARVRNHAAASRTFQLRYNGANVGSAVAIGAGQSARISAAITGTAGAASVAVRCTNSANTEVFSILHLQVEAGTQMTSECPAIAISTGTIQSGHTWSGTVHASTSSRTASSITVPSAAHFNPSRGAMLIRFQRGCDSGTFETIFDVGGGLGYDRVAVRINSADRLEVYWQTNGAPAVLVATTETVPLNTPCEAYLDWDGTVARVSLNGGTLYSAQRDLPLNIVTVNPINIGALIGGSLPMCGAIGGILITDTTLPDTTILPVLATAPWTIASLDVPVYYPIETTDGRLVHQTKFGGVNFGIYWGGDPEGMPDWSAPFLTVARHVPGSNITKVQTLGKGALTVTYRVQLDTIEDFLALQALQGTSQTLRVVGDTVTVPGTFIQVVDETFVDISEVTLMGITNVVVIPETREVDCDAIFLRQAS